MKIEEIIEMISTKTGKKPEELKAEVKEIFDSLKKENPDEADENLQVIATNKMQSLYRKKMTSRGEQFNGIIVGVGRRFDMVENKRATQQKIVDANPEQAIIDKLCNEKGDLLQWEPAEKVDKMPKWQKDNLGKVIPETDFRRTLLAVTIVDGKPIETEVRLRGENSKVVPKTFTKMSYRGFKVEQTSTDTLYKINDSGSFAPEYGDELTEEEAESLFKSLFSKRIMALDKIDTFASENVGRYSPEALMVMKVNVIDINTTPTKTGSTIVSVADDTIPIDEIVTCWVPEYMKITFPETSTIYVIGVPKSKDDKRSISVEGVYVPKIYVVPDAKDIETEKW